jgi:hypothetical protein
VAAVLIREGDITAKNTGNGYRTGTVDNRSQTYNPKTDSWGKRDAGSGRFIDQKTSDNKPFKVVSKEN